MNTSPNFLVTHGLLKRIWSNHSVLELHHQLRIELRNGWILIRDRTVKNKKNSGFISIPAPDQEREIMIELLDGSQASIRALPRSVRPGIEIASKLRIDPIPFRKEAPEESAIRKVLIGISTVMILACIAFSLNDMTEKVDSPDERLIPKKFAKLILTRPTAKTASSSPGGAAVSRAFRSKSVQKNLRTILQGGLSRYSILETGRSIREISGKMDQQGKGILASFGKETDRAFASLSSGGAKSGIPTTISGQGTGQLEIGLNFHDAIVEEGLTREEVAKVIHSHLNEIRYCYESAILSDPSLAGKVLIDFRIGSRGSVDSAQTTGDSMSRPDVGRCLVSKLKNWKFPSPRGGVQVAVTYPFLFKSVNR